MADSPKIRLLFALTIIVCALVFPRLASGQLITYIDTVQTDQYGDSISIDIYVDNFSGDSIAGYTLWISLSHADYIGFFSDSVLITDTTYSNCLQDSCVEWNADSSICLYYTCVSWADTTIDSYWVDRGALDTVGTLTSGWDFIDASILDDSNRVVKINAIADNESPYTPGIPSPTSQGLLCRIMVGIKDIQDSCMRVNGTDTAWLPWNECFCDSSIAIKFDTAQTRFSNPDGQFVGWTWSDTAWKCVFVPPDGHKECVRKCADDTLLVGEDYCNDSTCYYEYNSFCYLWECTDCDIWDSAGYVDPQQVLFSHGQIDVECQQFICGDANNDGGVNVSDAVWIINYVFVAGSPPPQPLEAGNVNCDSGVNVSDAVWIINFVFVSGSAAPCDC